MPLTALTPWRGGLLHRQPAIKIIALEGELAACGRRLRQNRNFAENRAHAAGITYLHPDAFLRRIALVSS